MKATSSIHLILDWNRAFFCTGDMLKKITGRYGKERRMKRYTKPEKVHQLLLDPLGFTLPEQAPPQTAWLIDESELARVFGDFTESFMKRFPKALGGRRRALGVIDQPPGAQTTPQAWHGTGSPDFRIPRLEDCRDAGAPSVRQTPPR